MSHNPIEIYLATDIILIGRQTDSKLQRIDTKEKSIEKDMQQAFKHISDLSIEERLNIYLDIKTGASGVLEQQIIPMLHNKVNNDGKKIIKEISKIEYIGEHLFRKHFGENESGSIIVAYNDITEITNIHEGKINHYNGLSILSDRDGEFLRKQYDSYCKIEKREASREDVSIQEEDTNPLYMTIVDFIKRIPKKKKEMLSTENLLICPMFESEHGINDKEMQELQALAEIANIITII